MRGRGLALIAGAALAGLPLSASAATLAAQMELRFGPSSLGGGGWNVPRLVLTNQSDAAQIVGATVTIGDVRFNFDGGGVPGASSAFFASAPGIDAVVQTLGDASHTGNGAPGRSWDALGYAFAGFDPGEAFSFDVDVDPDSTNGQTAALANRVMVNNGPVANAVLSVVFSDGTVLSGAFRDGPADATSYFANVSGTPVPAPPAAALLPLGALLLRRRRRA